MSQGIKQMKIALTGASSTGKTTLAREVSAHWPTLQIVNVDARALLQRLGHRNVSNISPAEFNVFQQEYIREKLQVEPSDNFVTERSYVDAFAYWEQTCAPVCSAVEHKAILTTCKRHAERYDLHIFLPFGILPFQSDGYRHPSADYHHKISRRIEELLQEWKVRYVCCNQLALNERVAVMNDAIAKL